MLTKNADTVLLFDESFYQFIQKVETHRTLISIRKTTLGI